MKITYTKKLITITLIFLVIYAWFIFSLSCQSATTKVTVTLAWDKSLDTNVTGYIVYTSTNGFYSSTQGQPYHTNFDVGTNLTAKVAGLPVGGKTFYFVVTAHDDLGMESDFSNEISYTTPEKPAPPTMLKRVTATLESSCVDPTGPWMLEKTFDEIIIASDTQKFFRIRMEIGL